MPSLVEICLVVLEKRIFYFRQCIFRYFKVISPCKRVGPFFWTNLNLLHPRILCAKFGWNWPSGSGEDENVERLQTDDRLMDRRRTTGQPKKVQNNLMSLSPHPPLQKAINLIDIINYINHILYLHSTTCSWSIVSSIYYIPLFISSLSTHVTSI